MEYSEDLSHYSSPTPGGKHWEMDWFVYSGETQLFQADYSTKLNSEEISPTETLDTYKGGSILWKRSELTGYPEPVKVVVFQ